jgi:3-oxoacyl-[acyl-carrier-protein] synthase III
MVGGAGSKRRYIAWRSEMKTRIESLGRYLPEREVSTSELISRMAMKPGFDLEKITGIKTRRVRSEDESSTTMAINAAEDCLSHSKYKPEDIDVVINASITRTRDGQKDFCFEPPRSLFYKEYLGARHALNFDITNACAGMATGAYILDNMIKAGQVKTGMVISGECITPIADTAVKEISEPIDDQFASLTVGDSGAAFIMDGRGSNGEGFDFVEIMTSAELSHLCIGQPSEKSAGMAMYTKSIEFQAVKAPSIFSNFLEELCENRSEPFEAAAYDYIIGHMIAVDSNRKYVKAIGEHFNVEPPEGLIVVQDLGNTSSTSMFVSLYTHLQNKRLKKGDRLLFIVLASGATFGLMSLTLGDLEV